MIHETGERILNDLEKRIGKLALPQILRWIAIFQALTWALNRFSPGFLQWIEFDQKSIYSGQVWRLFSWVLYPASDNILFVAIALLFMFFINDSLEAHWKSFRLNVYVISSVLCLSLLGLVPAFDGIELFMNSVFYSSAFLAFATLFPNHVIHLFAIIPIKAKWLGIANAALLAGMVLTSAALVAVIVVAGLLPYFLVFIPHFISETRQRGESSVRRHRFEKASSMGSDAFHTCESCGATDQTNPERSFRVTSDGEEFCENCRSPEAKT